MLASISAVFRSIMFILPMLTIIAMPPRDNPPDRRTWVRGRGRRKESRRRRRGKSEAQSGSMEDDDDEQPAHEDDPEEQSPRGSGAHSSSSDEAINDADQLADRIALNNDIMRQCKQTFETLHSRNSRLTAKYETMKSRLAIPSWGTSAQSPTGASGSGGPANIESVGNVTLVPRRTFADAVNKIPQPTGACTVNPVPSGNPAAAPIAAGPIAPEINPPPPPPLQPYFPHHDYRHPPERIANEQAKGVNEKGKGDRPMGLRGPGAMKGKDNQDKGKGKIKGIGKGKDKSNRLRTNEGLPAGAAGGNSREFINTNFLRMMESDLMDDDYQVNLLRRVASHLSTLVPINRIPNSAMADSQVNSAVVVTGLPWYSPEVDCLKDIMTLGGILNDDHYGVHYCQLNKVPDGTRNTGTAFIGFTNPMLANACIALFNRYQGPRGTSLRVVANDTGNPFHMSNPTVLGNPRADEECWHFPHPREDEAMSANANSFGSPTFKWNWKQIVECNLLP